MRLYDNAVKVIVDAIRTGNRRVTATDVQVQLLGHATRPSAAEARHTAILALRAFATIGVGRFRCGRRGHDTRLDDVC